MKNMVLYFALYGALTTAYWQMHVHTRPVLMFYFRTLHLSWLPSILFTWGTLVASIEMRIGASDLCPIPYSDQSDSYCSFVSKTLSMSFALAVIGTLHLLVYKGLSSRYRQIWSFLLWVATWTGWLTVITWYQNEMDFFLKFPNLFFSLLGGALFSLYNISDHLSTWLPASNHLDNTTQTGKTVPSAVYTVYKSSPLIIPLLSVEEGQSL